MKKWLLICAVMFLGMPMASMAQSDAPEDIDQAIEEARRQLDEAATLLGELYREQFSGKDGHSKRAMLGILLGDDRSDDGVEIVGVTPKGGADQAGMQAGDLIIKLNDLELEETDNPMKALSKFMKGIEAGSVVSVVFIRDGDREEVDITTQARDVHMLGMMEKKFEKLSQNMDIDLEGLADIPSIRREVMIHKGPADRFLQVSGDLADYFDVSTGVIIVKPPKGSALKGGDVILSIDGDDIDGVEAASNAFAEIDDKTEVVVKRKGKRKSVAVNAEEFADLGVKTKTHVIRIKKPSDEGDEVIVEVID